jgi:uncharacterized protein (DUF1800 family)
MIDIDERALQAPPVIHTDSLQHSIYPKTGLLIASALVAACGSGESGSPATTPVAGPAPAAPPTEKEARKFSTQALLSSSPGIVTAIQTKGYEAWLDEQLAAPSTPTRWQWLNDAGFNNVAFQNGSAGFDQVMWMKLLTSPDELRQKMTLALSQIFVVGIDGVPTTFRQFAVAHYMDTLEANAFGNLRTLLDKISTHPAMGVYLTFRGNQKANASTGSVPDENYARELLQLFTIGLYELNPDGTQRLSNGKPVETYDQDDITNLARVFTGWDFANNIGTTPDRHALPMVMIASRHAPEPKEFLTTRIAAGTDGVTSLRLALDHIFAHPNIGPFFCKQLIQRFVCSNPTPEYVARVVTVFNNNGAGVRGDLRAVLKAVLSDVEATKPGFTATSGKLKEPLLRFLQWARTFGAATNTAVLADQYKMGSFSDPATRLGQSPGRSPSVFNFFRPGYIPPSSQFSQLGLTAPEFQITHESSVAGYLNFMQGAITNGVSDVRPNYTAWLPKAADATALVNELNELLAGGAISSATLASITTAVTSLASSTDADKARRVQAAIFLVMASPEYLVNK